MPAFFFNKKEELIQRIHFNANFLYKYVPLYFEN